MMVGGDSQRFRRIRRVVLVGLTIVTLGAFPAPRGASSPGTPTLWAVIFDDFNGPYGSTTYSPVVTRVVDRIINEWRPDIVLAAGDLVAGQKSDLPDSRFPQMWQAFDAAFGAPLRQAGIPLGVALGNHDASAARAPDGGYRFGRERDYAAAYWRDPARRPRLEYRDDRHYPFYYSFLIKGVYVMAVDATSHVIQDAPWILKALRSQDATSARLRIVMGHLPLYGVSVGRSKFGEVIEEGERWRRVFEAYGVDLYISGHHAAYYPAHRGRLRLLHSGGGVGARPFVGHPEVRARSTVTLMEIDLDKRAVVLETFDSETGERVPLSDLPRCIDGYHGPVFRIDVAQTSRCGPRN